MAKRPAKPAPARLTFPPAVRVTAPPVDPRVCRLNPDGAAQLAVSFLTAAGPSAVAARHWEFWWPAGRPVDLLVITRPDVADLWLVRADAGGWVRCGGTWSPVLLVDPDRHDPARGHIAPSRFPRIVLE